MGIEILWDTPQRGAKPYHGMHDFQQIFEREWRDSISATPYNRIPVDTSHTGRSRARALVRTARLCPRIGNSKIWQPAGNERRAELLGRLAEISIGWRIFHRCNNIHA